MLDDRCRSERTRSRATAMTSSNILPLPFRRSHPVPLADAIKRYISTKYDQHPDMFKRDLEVIDELRRDAINVREAHVSGIAKLTKYAGQLAWVGGKFPVDVSLVPSFPFVH